MKGAIELRASLLVMAVLSSSCSGTAPTEAETHGANEGLTCVPLGTNQTSILGFENASQWVPAQASVALSSTRVEGQASLGVTPLSGYSTLTSQSLSTLPLVGKNLTLAVRVAAPPVNPTWFGNVTAYLDSPSRGLYGVNLGYQQLAAPSGGAFQTLHFTIPDYAYTALLAASYSDLKISFGLALPEGSAPYLFDRLGFDTCASSAIPVSGCREITTSGSYALTSDVSSFSALCLSIHDTANVTLDCAGHLVSGAPPLEVHDVQGFSIHDCRFESRQRFSIDIAQTTGGNFSRNTIQVPGSTTELGSVIGTNNTGLVFDSNTAVGNFDQSYSSGSTISNNHLTALPTPDFLGALINTVFGTQNKILNNVLDGKWPGTSPSDFTGTDDAIVLQDETGALVQNNTMRNLFDCGIEWLGTIRSATITDNHVTNAGICGIGGWYWAGLANSTIARNSTDQSLNLFLIRRFFGLRPAGWDNPGHSEPADPGVLFKDNVFDGNTFTNPVSPFLSVPASRINVYDDLEYDGSVSSIPGERMPTPADFQMTNNTFRNNDFGHLRGAPSFGVATAIGGLVIDGGNNTCSSPTTTNYPLVCH